MDEVMMTDAEREQARQDRLNEPGIEPPCPFCLKPRVTRSDYIRCMRCGLNWSEGQSIDRHPLATQPTKPSPMEIERGARPAESTTEMDSKLDAIEAN